MQPKAAFIKYNATKGCYQNRGNPSNGQETDTSHKPQTTLLQDSNYPSQEKVRQNSIQLTGKSNSLHFWYYN